MPTNVTFEQATAAPVGAMTAVRLLRQAGVTMGSRVLVHGASGSVGTFAVQLASHTGARGTAVCSTANVGLVASLGATAVIDYTERDFAAGDAVYDAIVDAAGKASRGRARAVLAEAGRYVSVRSAGRETPADLAQVASLLASGAIHSVIDRRYVLEQVREAHEYVERGHKAGNVVIRMQVGP
jgi:NADPH:quinone reductase-like Zn-dependent oxidoreductase